MWVLEKAGIERADLVVAVTGDDEDNLVIAQLAKHEYGVPKVVARVNNPRNQRTFDLLEVDSTLCAATMTVSMIQHELPSHQFVPLLSLKHEGLELVEIEVSDDSPSAHLSVGRRPAAARRAAGRDPPRRRGPAAARRRDAPARRPGAVPAAARA